MSIKDEVTTCKTKMEPFPCVAQLSHVSLVVLVTGPPASGKTAFIERMSSFLQTHKQFEPFENTRGNVTPRLFHITKARALCLDDYLAQLYEQQQNTSFSPILWHEASRLLYKEVESVLTSSIAKESRTTTAKTMTGGGVTVDLLLFVEDNMYYKSMRESYWKLCRRLNREHFFPSVMSNDTDVKQLPLPFTCLMELQFQVPLAICLERNTQRGLVAAPPISAPATKRVARVAVPAHVVRSMHELFESGVDSSVVVDIETDCVFRLPATTLPWCLVLVSLRHPQQYPDAAECASVFFGHEGPLCTEGVASEKTQRTTHSTSSFYQALQEQVASGWRAHLLCTRDLLQRQGGGREREREASRQVNAASLAHIFDERMRVYVKNFFMDTPHKDKCGSISAEEQKRLRKDVQALKKKYQAQFRTATKGTLNDTKEFDIMEDLLSSFCEDLLRCC